jgi:hypothetical protein
MARKKKQNFNERINVEDFYEYGIGYEDGFEDAVEYMKQDLNRLADSAYQAGFEDGYEKAKKELEKRM